MSERETYWGLLDFSFTEYFTIKAIKIIYILAIALSAIGALVILGGGFASRSFSGIVGGIIMAPIMFAVWVISARIWLELILVVFNISNNIQTLVELKEAEGGPGEEPVSAPQPEGPPPAEGPAPEQPKPPEDDEITL